MNSEGTPMLLRNSGIDAAISFSLFSVFCSHACGNSYYAINRDLKGLHVWTLLRQSASMQAARKKVRK